MLYKYYGEREEASGAVQAQGGRGAGGSTGQNETAPVQQRRQATEVMAGAVGGWDREKRAERSWSGDDNGGLLQLSWLH